MAPDENMSTCLDGLVSTTIPVYNRADMLLEAVQSVLTQTYRPIELIMVDDGSTDGTPQVLDSLPGSTRLSSTSFINTTEAPV